MIGYLCESPETSCYGNRIFIQANNPSENMKTKEANALLKKLCCWGNYDKRWEIDDILYNGYEFAHSSWITDRKAISDSGIKIQKLNKGHKIESR